MLVFLDVGRKTAFVILRFLESFTKVGKVFGGCCVCVFLNKSIGLQFSTTVSQWSVMLADSKEGRA